MDIKKSFKDILIQTDSKNISDALDLSQVIKDSIEKILAPHWSIQIEDEQYDDPELWNLNPAYEVIEEVYLKLVNINCFHTDGEKFNDFDLEQFEDVKKILEKFLKQDK
jgi:hypothetical protein